jgi:hypothetical protein
MASTSARLSRVSAIRTCAFRLASTTGRGLKVEKYARVSSWNVMVSDHAMLEALSSLNCAFCTQPMAA